MGMAASQARYLSLSARKTNTEYEGQQLNQQRLNIANQSADLFNQMLGMEVPTCPDSNDFTKIQYSWSDGINDEVISDFYQIAVPNEKFNYVVTSYRYEKAYVGQSKRMNSPEIQHAKINSFTDMPDKDYQVLNSVYHRESSVGAGDDSYTITVQRNGTTQQSTHIFKRMDKTIDSVEEIDAFTNRTTGVTAGDKATYFASQAKSDYLPDGYPATWTFEDQDIVFVGTKIGLAPGAAGWDPTQKMTGDDATTPNMPYKSYTAGVAAGTQFKKLDLDDDSPESIKARDQLRAIYGDKFDPSKTYYYAAMVEAEEATDPGSDPVQVKVKGVNATGTSPNYNAEFEVYQTPSGKEYYKFGDKYYSTTTACDATEVETTTSGSDTLIDGQVITAKTKAPSKYTFGSNNVTDAAGNQLYAFICGEDMDAAVGSQGDIAQVEVRTGDDTAYYTDGKYILTAAELSAIDLTDDSNLLDAIFFHREENNPSYTNFTAVGNCKLNHVSVDDYKASQDMQIEIQRVIDDMKDGGNAVAFGNLSACFDPTTGEYMGGIYAFEMFDHTYYTTTADLETAAAGAYRDIAVASNGIDSQNKLCYYTSTQIEKKVEETKKALMETDGKGRFSSVKFEDDDTVYTLKVETIKDDDAYNNAMNQYFYKQEQYDKAIADLNAKNEIIQAQDRELQLRLEQLGTEQTALQTEMEACQKVVSKSIESTFKTFGG